VGRENRSLEKMDLAPLHAVYRGRRASASSTSERERLLKKRSATRKLYDMGRVQDCFTTLIAERRETTLVSAQKERKGEGEKDVLRQAPMKDVAPKSQSP